MMWRDTYVNMACGSAGVPAVFGEGAGVTYIQQAFQRCLARGRGMTYIQQVF